MVDDPELGDQVRVGGDSEQRHCSGGLLHRRRRPRPRPHLHNLYPVMPPYGNNLHHHENVTHDQFSVTITKSGNYVACFWMNGQHQDGAGLTIGVDWKIEIATKDWDSIAKKEKIEGVELERRKLERAVEAIHSNLIYLKNREADMKEISEITNARVAWFSIMSLSACIVVAIFQLWYLRTYFQKRKLI